MLFLHFRGSTLLSVALALCCYYPKQAHAQEHFADCVSLTGSNANVIVPASIDPRVDGDSLAPGDEIALFTPEGLCAGVITWNAGNGSITAWGENTITPEKDGFAVGDTILFRVWDASAGREARNVAVGYSAAQPFYRIEGTYNENAIYALSSFDALTDPPSPAIPPLVDPQNGSQDVEVPVTLTWESVPNADLYEMQVSTDGEFAEMIVQDTALVTTTYDLIDLQSGQTYYWRVRALGSSESSAYSTSWYFTTAANGGGTGSNDPPAVGHPIEDQVIPVIGGIYVRDLAASPAVFLDEDDGGLVYSVHSSDRTVADANVNGSVLSVEAVGEGESIVAVKAVDGDGEATTSFVVSVDLDGEAGLVAVADEVETEEDNEVLIDVLRNDFVTDTASISVTMIISPSHGSASVEGKQIRYRPMTNYNGRDSLVYHLHDLSGGSASAKVIILVAAVDDPPTFASAEAIVTPEDGAVLLIGGATEDGAGSPEDVLPVEWVEAIDVDGDPVRYVWTLARSADFEPAAMEIETSENRIEATHGMLDDLLAEAGIDVGASLTLYHRVVAVAAQASTESEIRSISLTRGVLQSTNSASDDPPSGFRLDQNYPNPFNPETTITFSIERTAYVRLSVYDTLGKEVATVLTAEKAPGEHEVQFDAEDLTSGIYLYRLETGSRTATRQMVLLR